MQRTRGSCFPNIFRLLTFKMVSAPPCSLIELQKGRAELLGAAIVFVGGWRFIIMPFLLRVRGRGRSYINTGSLTGDPEQ